ncbi:hypothetical protein H4Q26_014110 [Puccinia striiformis f. sp. tritici PST-130]|nr:hypothetical protein H4Q26_014110 [Puccinia striiformis f. sp. tritici PST-130]
MNLVLKVRARSGQDGRIVSVIYIPLSGLKRKTHHADQLLRDRQYPPLLGPWESHCDGQNKSWEDYSLKKFVNPVGGSRGWGGRMWAVGWRKCMKALEILDVISNTTRSELLQRNTVNRSRKLVKF